MEPECAYFYEVCTPNCVTHNKECTITKGEGPCKDYTPKKLTKKKTQEDSNAASS